MVYVALILGIFVVNAWNALASSTHGGITLTSTTLASSTGYLKYSSSIADPGRPVDIGKVFVGFQKYLYEPAPSAQ
jgi:hypothetical protein